jgi:hypothetical protein
VVGASCMTMTGSRRVSTNIPSFLMFTQRRALEFLFLIILSFYFLVTDHKSWRLGLSDALQCTILRCGPRFIVCKFHLRQISCLKQLQGLFVDVVSFQSKEVPFNVASPGFRTLTNSLDGARILSDRTTFLAEVEGGKSRRFGGFWASPLFIEAKGDPATAGFVRAYLQRRVLQDFRAPFQG